MLYARARVCICMCVYVSGCLWMCVCARASVCTCVYACVMRVTVCVWICLSVRIGESVCVCACVGMCTCLRVYMSVSTYMCEWVSMSDHKSSLWPLKVDYWSHDTIRNRSRVLESCLSSACWTCYRLGNVYTWQRWRPWPWRSSRWINCLMLVINICHVTYNGQQTDQLS